MPSKATPMDSVQVLYMQCNDERNAQYSQDMADLLWKRNTIDSVKLIESKDEIKSIQLFYLALPIFHNQVLICTFYYAQT